MPYTATSWVDGTTLLNQSHLNNLETQYSEATQSFEQDLFSAFVLSGLVATKDGTIANQLDVTAGVAFLLQSSDNTLRRRAPTSSTQTTATPSTTYHLYLQPDGTWYWSTSNSPAANSLFIAQVTTDASGNILAVTDERALTTSFLGSMLGNPVFTGVDIATNVSGGTYPAILDWDTGGTGNAYFKAPQGGGSAHGVYFGTWSGSAGVVPFSVGGQLASALAWVDNSGNFNGPAGGGVPTTRNGTASSVPIYTGTSTPSSPPTGCIWVKA